MKKYKVVSIKTLKSIAANSKQAAKDHRAEYDKTGSLADMRLAEYCEGQAAICENFIKNLAEVTGDRLFGVR